MGKYCMNCGRRNKEDIFKICRQCYLKNNNSKKEEMFNATDDKSINEQGTEFDLSKKFEISYGTFLFVIIVVFALGCWLI